MTDNEKIPSQARLIFFTGALRELDQLAEALGEIDEETGIEPPGHLAHYILGRRSQLTANIDKLLTEIKPVAS